MTLNIPRHLYQRTPLKTTLKMLFALLVIALFTYFIVIDFNNVLTFFSLIIVGVMYAHLIEFQHELLHNHVFKSKPLNKVLGILVGLPMLNSFTHYKIGHLEHHRTLGTDKNKEFYDYKFKNLDSIFGFLTTAFSLHRYKSVIKETIKSFKKLSLSDKTKEAKQIRFEYRMFAFLTLGITFYTIITGNIVFIKVWLIPILLVSEATHFLIELPEHYALNTQSNPNPFSNTRTIKGSILSRWLTNYNNYHAAHHFHSGVPIQKTKNLNLLISKHVDKSSVAYFDNYLSFYIAVIGGKLKHNPSTSAMKN